MPCYHLRRLHEAVKHELPPSPRGFVTTWKLIIEITEKQKQDPTYQYVAQLPTSTAS